MNFKYKGMQKVGKLYETLKASALHTLDEGNEEDFSNLTKSYDWRNYVNKELRAAWRSLSGREQKIIFILTQ